METRIDTEGKILIPKTIREKLGITEDTRFMIEAQEGNLVLKPQRQKQIEDLFGHTVDRTGDPEWESPQEIKSIWA